MNTKTTLGLLAALIFLCCGYYAMTWRHERSLQMEIKTRQPFAVPAKDIARISIQQEDKPPVVGVRDEAGNWRITSPREIDAFPDIWNRLTEKLSSLATERTVDESPSDLAQYELNAPRLKVAADTKDGQSVVLTFGKAGPTQSNRYARIDEGAVVLISGDDFAELDRDLGILRWFHLVNPGETGVTKVAFAWLYVADEKNKVEGLKPGDVSTELIVEKQPDGGWLQTAPISAPVNMDSFTRFVNALQTGSCADFVDTPENLGDYGLDPGGARVTITTGQDSPPQVIYFGHNTGEVKGKEKDGRVFAKWSNQPSVFTVEKMLWDFFPQSPDSWRERRLITHDQKHINRLHFVTQTEEFTLTCDPKEGWRIIAPTEELSDQAAVSGFINSLIHCEGKEFVDPKSGLDMGFAAPRMIITFGYDDGAPDGSIQIANPVEGAPMRYVTQDIGVILKLDNAFADRLLAIDFFSFRDKTIYAFDPVKTARVMLSIDNVDYVFERPAQSWHVTTPANLVWGSQTDADALMKALQKIQATRIERTIAEAAASPEGLAPFGLDVPVMTLAAVLKDDNGVEKNLPVLKAGAVTGENSRYRYCMVESRPEIFRIAQSILDDVRAALRLMQPR